jgi:hypothetical protein
MTLQETVNQLFEVAKKLNEASDELNVTVAVLNDRLKAMNLGIPVWIPVKGDLHVGYAKTPAWGIAVSKGVEMWPFANAPRKLRLEVVDSFPELLLALADSAAKVTMTLEKGLEVLERLK